MTCTCHSPRRHPVQLHLPLREAGYREAFVYALPWGSQQAWLYQQAMRPTPSSGSPA